MDFTTARRRVGLSQTAFAKEAGVSSGTVSGWETGKVEPSAKQIPKLSEVLQLPPEEVVEMMKRKSR